MTATVTVVNQPSNSPPRKQLTLAGFTSATVATIIRTDPAGNQSYVRTGNPAPIVSGGQVLYDYEAPYGQAVTYTATPDVGSPVTSSASTLAVTSPWLVHPGFPALSCKLLVASVGDRTMDVNQGVHTVLGRSTPIVITDGTRRAETFDLTVRTENLIDEAALLGLLSDTSTLLLQIVYSGISRTRYDWVSVGQVTQSDLVEWFGNVYTTWTLPCTVTDEPAGLLQAEYTWNDVIANYATWSAVKTAFATWNDVVTNNPR